MLDIEVRGSLRPLIAALNRLANPDLTGLAGSVRGEMIASNRARALAGLDGSGSELAPLRGGRPLTGSESNARGGDGPPLAPRGEGSRVVAAFAVEVVALAGEVVAVWGSWPGCPFLEYQARVGRDVAGLPDDEVGRFGDLAGEFADALADQFIADASAGPLGFLDADALASPFSAYEI